MESISRIKDIFYRNLETVTELHNFDRVLLDLCIHHIDELNNRLKSAPFEIGNKLYLAENTVAVIKNIRNNDSLRPEYKHIFNSCLVLQVSYFTSALDDMFSLTLEKVTRKNIPDEIKKYRPNFQNIHSVKKTFKKYLMIDIDSIVPREIFNDILLVINARHNIVHCLGKVDMKFLNNTANAVPRKLKNNYRLNHQIQFVPNEINYVKTIFSDFINVLHKKLISIS